MTSSKKDSRSGAGEGRGSNPAPDTPQQPGQNAWNSYLGDEVPGLVPPSHLNEGDTGAASDKPAVGGELDFDDGSMWERGKNVRTGGTYEAQGADSAPLGPPAEILSSTNQPSEQRERPESASKPR